MKRATRCERCDTASRSSCLRCSLTMSSRYSLNRHSKYLSAAWIWIWVSLACARNTTTALSFNCIPVHQCWTFSIVAETKNCGESKLENKRLKFYYSGVEEDKQFADLKMNHQLNFMWGAFPCSAEFFVQKRLRYLGCVLCACGSKLLKFPSFFSISEEGDRHTMLCEDELIFLWRSAFAAANGRR